MEKKPGDDGYCKESRLMDTNQKIIFQRLTEEIFKKQGAIAIVLRLKEKNEKVLFKYAKTIEELESHQAPKTKIKWRTDNYATYDKVQWKIVQTLLPTFDEVFNQIASDFTLGGLEYNEELRKLVWLDFVFGERLYMVGGEVGRELYWYDAIAKNRQINQEKKQEKKFKEAKERKEKVRLPQDHHLLHEQSYPQLKLTMWTHVDNIVSTYQKNFLSNTNDTNQTKELIDHYFLFIFLQMLIQSKVVFDTKKPKSSPFFQQVIDDCIVYLQEKYCITLTIFSDTIKKKFFNTLDEASTPLELLYKNCMEEDLIQRESYLNDYFFVPKQTSADLVRRKIMVEYNKNAEKMTTSRELINPLYHIYKEKKEYIIKTLERLEQYRDEHKLIPEMIEEFQKSLKEAEQGMMDATVFEDNPPTPKDPDSLVKIEQQYLKRYQVPVQYRKIFGLVINRLNNYFQVKHNISKKVRKYNNEALLKLIHSDQKLKDILYYINDLITQKHITSLFDEKWNGKKNNKIERIQRFCLGTEKVSTPPKKKKKKEFGEGQFSLIF